MWARPNPPTRDAGTSRLAVRGWDEARECAEISSASGRAGTGHNSAHIGAPIVAEMCRLHQLQLGGDVEKKSQLQLDDRSSATEARHELQSVLSRAHGHRSATKWECEVCTAYGCAPRVRQGLGCCARSGRALEPAHVGRRPGGGRRQLHVDPHLPKTARTVGRVSATPS